VTRRIFYSQPYLAYRAYIQGLMKIEELPKYAECVNLSHEEWLQFIGVDVDKLIELLNIDIPPTSLLPPITLSMLQSASADMPWSLQPSVNTQVVQLIQGLTKRLEELKVEVLEPLIHRLPILNLFDRMVKLKMNDAIRRIYNLGMVPSCHNWFRDILALECSEMIDLYFELSDRNVDDMIVETALEEGYTYPLKYVKNMDKVELYNDASEVINISREDLFHYFKDTPIIANTRLLIRLIASGRVELVKELEGLMNDEELEEWNSYKMFIPLSYFHSLEDYRLIMGRDPQVNVRTIMMELTSDRHSELLRSTIASLSLDCRMGILIILSASLMMLPTRRVSLVEYVIDGITPQQFKEFFDYHKYYYKSWSDYELNDNGMIDLPLNDVIPGFVWNILTLLGDSDNECTHVYIDEPTRTCQQIPIMDEPIRRYDEDDNDEDDNDEDDNDEVEPTEGIFYIARPHEPSLMRMCSNPDEPPRKLYYLNIPCERTLDPNRQSHWNVIAPYIEVLKL
jgi:hypothetical protein